MNRRDDFAKKKSDLEILEEKVLVGIPVRGDGREEMRVTFVRARSGDKDIAWHSVGVYWRTDDGQWRRGKGVATIRGKELHGVVIALLRAVASSVPPALHESARQLVAALGGGRT